MSLGEKPINSLTDAELSSDIAQTDHASPRMVALMKEREQRLQMNSKDSADNHWYKKPVGIVVLSISAGLLLLLLKFALGL